MTEARNSTVDLLRLIAVFGVIMIHLAPSTARAELLTEAFLSFAVPYFLLISLYFFLERLRAHPERGVSDLRLDRLLVPYAIWTVIYTVLRVLKYRLHGESPALDPVGIIFFGASAVHLYFLPLLLLLQLVALAGWLLGRPGRGRGAGVAAGLVAVGFGFAARGRFGFDDLPVRVAVYLALALLLQHLQSDPRGRRFHRFLGLLAPVAIGAVGALGIPTGARAMLLTPLIGYGVAALALNWRIAATSPAGRAWLTCSYGIYLAHFAFLEAFEVARGRTVYAATPYTVEGKLLVAGAIFLASTGFVFLARRQRLFAYLLLGESASRRQVALPA